MIKNSDDNTATESSEMPSRVASAPTELELLTIATKWHQRINEEFKNPILPEDLTPEVRERKLNDISRQREKHKLYCRVLEKLIRSHKQDKES